MKRVFDIFASALGIIMLSPVFLAVLFLVWNQDYHSPFYRGTRVGKNRKLFQMAKIRSMIIGADKTGVESTGAHDSRITAVGHFVRKWKIDELTQLWNVLKGDMSLVGPRPNTLNGISTYSDVEQKLLTIKPGITDFSSIIFSDEGEILKNAADPDSEYDRLIRPWKSQLGLIYVENQTVLLDVRLIILTISSIFDRSKALHKISDMLEKLDAPPLLLEVAKRNQSLEKFAAGNG